MRELSKSIARRLNDSRFSRYYFKGDGVDIGGAPDPLVIYQELFPLMTNCRTWDLDDGDAQFMESVADNTFDFVHSSHCLEHVHDPFEALKNWLRVLKPGGYIVVTIPDEDLYEQGVWPPQFNLDHKKTFTLFKPNSWAPDSVNVIDMISALGLEADCEKLELLNSTYRFSLPRYDQTSTPVGECAIEIIIRKRTPQEVEFAGRPILEEQPSDVIKIHLNQYRDDHATLKANNPGKPPFQNDSDL
ncbi:MAG: class I SAM-dependent methyltransferase [Pseudomonadota bacterium]